jgi:dihydropteroate synthase
MKQTKIIGILNITPDSFFDGGKFNNYSAAINHARQLIKEGADGIDIGAESTRPGAITIEPKQEWQRLENILPELITLIKKHNLNSANKKITISLDSRNLATAKKAFELKIDVINDVSGLVDLKMIEFIAANNISTILMHSLSIPSDPQIIIDVSKDCVKEIIDWALAKIANLQKLGVKKEQLIFDPGIGFGKNSLQSFEIIKRIEEFKILGLPLYIGHSRKRFIGDMNFNNFKELEPDNAEFSAKEFNNFNRSKKTILVSKYLIKKQVDFIRVHDVKENLQ